LGRQEEARQLAARFSPSLLLRRPWLGGLVITSDASPHPLVAYVTPDGPLASAFGPCPSAIADDEDLAEVEGVART
jgi:hypothetical protein